MLHSHCYPVKQDHFIFHNPTNINVKTMNINIGSSNYPSQILQKSLSQNSTSQKNHKHQKSFHHSFYNQSSQHPKRKSYKLNESFNYNYNSNLHQQFPSQAFSTKHIINNKCTTSQITNYKDSCNPQTPSLNSNSTIKYIQKNQTQLEIQNSQLRQQNQILKNQLFKFKNYYFEIQSVKTKENSLSKRQNRKSQIKQIYQFPFPNDYKQISIRLQMSLNQCKIYQDIIQKMENKIQKLIYQNKFLSNQNQKRNEIEFMIQQMSTRINKIFNQYQKLQNMIKSSQQQWLTMSQQWVLEKQFYLNKIEQLQGTQKIYMNIQTSISRYQTPSDQILKQQINLLKGHSLQ